MTGRGCSLCYGNKNTGLSEFIQRAKEIHGDRYDYSKSIYKNRREKLEIICKIHGSYFQNAGIHLMGSKCPECSLSDTGWTKTSFKNHCIKNNNGLRNSICNTMF